jgi:hypothetical protein
MSDIGPALERIASCLEYMVEQQRIQERKSAEYEVKEAKESEIRKAADAALENIREELIKQLSEAVKRSFSTYRSYRA